MIDKANRSNTLNSRSVTLCFKSLNNSCPKMYTYPLFIRMSLFTFFGTISLLTVMGNLLVVIAVAHFKQLHTPTNYLILSLAVADLLVGALLMPFFMVNTVESCWYTGQLHCRIHLSLAIMFYYASILHLSLIAIDRYFAVCYPLTYKTTITSSITVFMIFLCWTLAATAGLCASFVPFQNMHTQKLPLNIKMCEGICVRIQNKVSAVLSPIIEFYIPSIVVVCLYAKIYHIAKRQAKLIHDRRLRGRKKSNLVKKESKATKTLAIVMGVFLAFWLPFFICYLLYPFTGYSIPPPVFQTFTWIGCFNSLCNPIVYALSYSWFRKAVRLFLYGKDCKMKSARVDLFA